MTSNFRLPPFVLLMLAVGLTMTVSGCATIFNGTSQQVKFNSEPQGADVVVDGLKRGETPATVTLTKPGLDEKRVTFQKEGYEVKTVTLPKKFATASILNVLGFTVVGFGIDAVSGALFNYYPTELTVELTPKSPPGEKKASLETKWHSLRALRTDEHGTDVAPRPVKLLTVLDTDTGRAYVVGARTVPR